LIRTKLGNWTTVALQRFRRERGEALLVNPTPYYASTRTLACHLGANEIQINKTRLQYEAAAYPNQPKNIFPTV